MELKNDPRFRNVWYQSAVGWTETEWQRVRLQAKTNLGVPDLAVYVPLDHPDHRTATFIHVDRTPDTASERLPIDLALPLILSMVALQVAQASPQPRRTATT